MDLDPFLPARTRAAPATATRRRRPLSISPPAPIRDPGLSARRAGVGAARPQVRAGSGWSSEDAEPGGGARAGGCPRVLVAAGPGRTWERGPEPRNAGLGSGSGGGWSWSLPRLDLQACRSPCACAAPGMKKRGKKLPAPGCVMQGMLRGTIAVAGGVGSKYDTGAG